MLGRIDAVRYRLGWMQTHAESQRLYQIGPVYVAEQRDCAEFGHDVQIEPPHHGV